MSHRCHRCPDRARVILASGELICFDCYNRAVRETEGKVEARTLRRSF